MLFNLYESVSESTSNKAFCLETAYVTGNFLSMCMKLTRIYLYCIFEKLIWYDGKNVMRKSVELIHMNKFYTTISGPI